MVPVRHQGDVTRTDQRLGVDVPGRRGVAGEAAERDGIRRGLRVAGRGGLEVVDLLEPGFVSGNAFVVLVGRMRGPVPAGCDDLADDERRRVQRVRGPEVVRLPGVAPRSPHLYGYIFPGQVTARLADAGRRLGDGDAAAAANRQRSPGTGVENVGRAGEDALPAVQHGRRLVVTDPERSGQRDDDPLDVRGGQFQVTVGQDGDPQPRVPPAINGGVHHGLPGAAGQGPPRVEPLVGY